MLFPPAGPGIVLSPHPDDSVLSSWAALTHGADVRVVDVFGGLPPAGTLGTFDPVFGVEDSHAFMVQRRDEDRRALATVGRVAVVLDFLDEQYRTTAADDVLRGELEVALAPLLDDAAWLSAPAGIGAHPDHVLVRDVAVGLARDRRLPLSLYSELPYAIWAGWPHWVTGLPPRPYLVPEVRWRADLASIPGVEIDQLTPVPQAFDEEGQQRKLAAIRCYESQFEALNAGPIGRLVHPEVLGFELHWQVPGPTQG